MNATVAVEFPKYRHLDTGNFSLMPSIINTVQNRRNHVVKNLFSKHAYLYIAFNRLMAEYILNMRREATVTRRMFWLNDTYRHILTTLREPEYVQSCKCTSLHVCAIFILFQINK